MLAHRIGFAITLAGVLAACAPPYYGPYEPYGPYAPGPYVGGPYGGGRYIPPAYPANPNYQPPYYPNQPYQGQAAPNYAQPNYQNQPAPNYGQAPNQNQLQPPLPEQQQAYAGAPAPVGPPLRAAAYVMDSGSADQYEIDAAMIARTRAQNPAVRNFAEMMITAHTATTQDLLSAVNTAGMQAPPPARPTTQQRVMLDQLQRSAANTFDRLYMDQQAAAHQQALAMHRAYADRGDQAALRAFAARTWPKVQMHFDEAQSSRGPQRL
jgi:putative membrane protein